MNGFLSGYLRLSLFCGHVCEGRGVRAVSGVRVVYAHHRSHWSEVQRIGGPQVNQVREKVKSMGRGLII
jgi:hypothetical protein